MFYFIISLSNSCSHDYVIGWRLSSTRGSLIKSQHIHFLLITYELKEHSVVLLLMSHFSSILRS